MSQIFGNKSRNWAPRLWLGMNVSAWLRLLIRNHFSIDFSRLYIAFIDTCFSIFNSFLWIIKEIFYRKKIKRFRIQEDLIFIIGHWRTGTTLLHELLALDSQHTYPNSYQCFSPNHFLITEKKFTKLLFFLIPTRRPMDNMEAGWDRPQEDEFALCNLGVPSPYWTIAFPNNPPQFPEYFKLEKIGSKSLEKWKNKWVNFIKEVLFKYPQKRLVLKSPPHTFRIKVILDVFPEAKFINLIRDPYTVFPSTIHLWKNLFRTHGLQKPRFEGLEDFVFNTFIDMYQKLEEGRDLVDPARFYDLKYEDLVKNPVGQMKNLYEHLNLGAFEKVKPAIEGYFKKISDYQTNRYELSPATRKEITKRWGSIIEKLGYPLH